MITNFVSLEARNADGFPVTVNAETIDMIYLPDKILAYSEDDGLMGSLSVVLEYDKERQTEPHEMRLMFANGRNTELCYNDPDKLRADLDRLLEPDSGFVLMKCQPSGKDKDRHVLVNLRTVHQVRHRNDKKRRRLYFDFVSGCRQFLEGLDREDIESDLHRIQMGGADMFTTLFQPKEVHVPVVRVENLEPELN